MCVGLPNCRPPKALLLLASPTYFSINQLAMGFLNVKRAPSNLSVAFLVSLSLLMMSFGVAPYLNVVRPPADTPILGTFRDPVRHSQLLSLLH